MRRPTTLPRPTTPRRSTASRLPFHRTLRCEPLEDRRMLSVLFVDADAASGGDGLAWGTAYRDLQDALSQAAAVNADGDTGNDVDQIWVAEGVYKPSERLEPGDPRSASFSLVDGVTVYGGFVGVEVTLDERDWAAHVTVLSGDLGTANDDSDNAYTVVYSGEEIATAVDGASVTEGNADQANYPQKCRGGGIRNSGTLTVMNTTLSGNTASRGGGGIYNSGMLTVEDSTVLGNDGSGIYNSGTLTIRNSSVSQNDGGGVSNSGTLAVTGSMLAGNTAHRGGGISNSGILTVTNSTFWGNAARDGGGGIYCHSGTSTITNTTFSGNTAEYDGGAIYNHRGTLNVSNSTLSGNAADDDGAGICNFDTLTLNNSILWQNHGEDLEGYGTATASHNLLGLDPRFVRDPSDGGDGWGDNPDTAEVDESANDDFGDLRLTPQSPAIDYGDDALAVDVDGNPLSSDLDGNQRNYNGSPVDVGAFEFQGDMAAGREDASLRVNTSADVGDLYDGQISLREAIFYASFSSPDTTITFDETLEEATITLSGTSLWIDKGLAIDASSLTSLTISANNQSRVFTVVAHDDEEMELRHLTILDGSAHFGGGIFGSGTLTVTNSLLSQNTAFWAGGAIQNVGTLTVRDSTFSRNVVSYWGGGIHNSGVLTLVNSGLLGNESERYGGGVYSELGTMAITNTTISGNTAGYHGGGILNSSPMTITNTTISGNAAGDQGGGIHNNYSGELTLNNSIVAQNTARSGSDFYQPSSSSCIFTGSHNFVGGNPKFLRSPSDGGDGWGDDPSTPDIDESANDDYGDLRLRPDSPAIDAGDGALLPPDTLDLDDDGDTTAPIPFDLAGNARISGAAVDMGAYEFLLSGIPGDLNNDSMVNSSDLDIIRANWGQTVTPGSLLDGDPTGDGTVNSDDLNIVRANWGSTTPVAAGVGDTKSERVARRDVTVATRQATDAALRNWARARRAWAEALEALARERASETRRGERDKG